MSCGCALYFFKLAAKRFGYFAEIEYFPESSSQDLLARVRIVPSEPTTNYELNMFSAISERHTNRQACDERGPLKRQSMNLLVLKTMKGHGYKLFQERQATSDCRVNW